MELEPIGGIVNQSLGTVLAEAEGRYVASNPASRALHANARAYLPGGNTRTTVHFSPFPLYLAGGKGGRVHDVDGHSYADFINEYTAGVFGHTNEVIADAVRSVLASGINLGGPSSHEIDLSARIRKRFPAMELLRFCNSGTEANLLALATARAFTGKDAVMVMNGAYHGSMLHFSHGSSPLNMPIPVIKSTFNDAERIVSDIEANAARLSAVILEPMQGGAGALPAEPGFLTVLRDVTCRHSVLLIFDEVMTSRLHPNGLNAWYGIRPDLMTLGKYIGGGMTLGAFGGRSDVMSRFDPGRPDTFPHGGTFNNNVVAMVAGCAAFDTLLRPEDINDMNNRGNRMRDRMNELAERMDLPVRTSGFGAIFGIHFHQGLLRNINDLEAAEAGRELEVANLKKLFHFDMIEAGQYVSRRILGNLSLVTTDEDVDAFVNAFEEFLVTRGSLIKSVILG